MKGQANLNQAASDPESAASGLAQVSPLPVRSTMTRSEVQDTLSEAGIETAMPGIFVFCWPDRQLVPYAEMERKARIYAYFNEPLAAKIRWAIEACNVNCLK